MFHVKHSRKIFDFDDFSTIAQINFLRHSNQYPQDLEFWYTFAKKEIVMPNYPSNITRQQFEVIRSELENFCQRTKPRQVDLYDVFCAILYILKTGAQWRALPHDFPKWQTVYTYFRLWSRQPTPAEPSLLDRSRRS